MSWYPGASSSALLSYEDQWPSAADLDYNDVVVRAHYRIERHATGGVKTLYAVFDPVALGGDHSNGLGLQLPASRSRLVNGVEVGNVTARRRVGGGGWQTLTPESDGNVTLVLSPNLRELFGDAPGRVNSQASANIIGGTRLELEITFDEPAAFGAGVPFADPPSSDEAPFDVFIFRADTVAPNRHEIHFPRYAGTASMRTSLFQSEQDGSDALGTVGGRWFVHAFGTPAALNLQTTTFYPTEGTRIDLVFPAIVTFATSRGGSAKDFYDASKPANNVSQLATRRNSVAAAAVPSTAAADASCAARVSCAAWRNSGGVTSGVYRLDPDGTGPGAPFNAYCDQTTSGGGWALCVNARTTSTTYAPSVQTDLTNNFNACGMVQSSATSDRLVKYNPDHVPTNPASSTAKAGTYVWDAATARWRNGAAELRLPNINCGVSFIWTLIDGFTTAQLGPADVGSWCNSRELQIFMIDGYPTPSANCGYYTGLQVHQPSCDSGANRAHNLSVQIYAR